MYEVYAVARFDQAPAVLVRNDNRSPEWYAMSVFEVVDGALPIGWKFGQGAGYEVLFGYSELADRPEEMPELVELRQEALRNFARQVQARTSELAVDATPTFGTVSELGNYFHQDYDLLADTPLGVVEHFVRNEPAESTARLLAEVEALLAAGLDEVAAHRIWMIEGWASYDPADDDLSYVDWFVVIRDLLKG
ncbi:contact-dependent growth inhibition system immunity protein [Amycolatopsis sp. lyj-84]|uniref:contact-dependent growth inhibition system immunity protein n=1 Tax=Amycolatopsis sp. lyj-84 TaxID=2789284 RepID=UPI00397D3DC7